MSALADYLDELVGRKEFRGAVRVRLGCRVLLNRGYGVANAASGEVNGPDTRFRIGSVTKQFTALAVLTLREQGRLAVDDPVCAYLPHCPPAWTEVSIRQLLTHTSGLVNPATLSDQDKAAYLLKFGTRPSPEQLVAAFCDWPLEFPPGSQWKYSNFGYSLLGHLIELVSGQDYGTFLRDEIFDPLGMKDSGYPEPTDQHAVATGYENWSTPAGNIYPLIAYASGGIYSTTNDLARWNDFLLTGSPPVVPRDALAELLRPHARINERERYGYGINIVGTNGNPIYSHNGRVPGFVSYNEVRPVIGLAVTVLSNLATTNVENIGATLAALAAE